MQILGTLPIPGHSPVQHRHPELPTLAQPLLYLLCTGLPLPKTHEAKVLSVLCVADFEWWAQMSGAIWMQLR